jgi:hypothetical protein
VIDLESNEPKLKKQATLGAYFMRTMESLSPYRNHSK